MMDYSGVESSTAPGYLPAVERQKWTIAAADLRNTTVARELLALQRASYAIEAELISCPDFPPLRESLEEIQKAADTFLVFSVLGNIAGALSYVLQGEMVHVTRLVVSPAYFRQGIAMQLLSEVERCLPDVKCFCVTTAELNVPAIRLYLKAGYAMSGVTQSPEGIRLVHLHKARPKHAAR